MKNMTLVALLLPIAVITTMAEPAVATTKDNKDDGIEEVVVIGRSVSADRASIAVSREPTIDTAALLSRLPGADANSNGRITGIAQYRGMYGDRVSVSIDGLGVIGGGPNAMDAPLSYVSPMITEELILKRGVPGVASAPETIGGHIDARLARGQFGHRSEFGLTGMAGARYSPNGDTSTMAARLTVANQAHRISIIGEANRADDVDTPAGTIVPSRLSRDRYDISYAFTSGQSDLLAFVGGLNTEDTGTPALPMDIRYIDTQMAGFQYRTRPNSAISIGAKIGYNDVDHLMDNFTLRAAPELPAGYRQNLTSGSGTVFDVTGEYEADRYALRFGFDGRLARHESVITNPNNPMFFINNFVGLERDTLGTYAALSIERDLSEWELGVRYNRVTGETDTVANGGMMGMMEPLVDELADAFNSADRSQDFGNTDVVLKYRRTLADNLRFHVDLASKSRAPSYQELYLWLPLQATGGLADGRSYIGNLDLNSERSAEISIGIDWSGERFEITPQAYFKDISDYIQGVASTNSTANMLAMMMTGKGALEFANVDAEIYGFDVDWRYALTDELSLDGTASYSRGRRTDVSDNLYRLPPLNVTFAINLDRRAWGFRGELVAFAGQDKVSAFNDEQPSAGYAVLNGMVTWNGSERLRIELHASNLLDRAYQAHLAGINRAGGMDIAVSERIYGTDRTLTIGAMFDF